jgi:Fe-S cluster assembly scaffold protein SufB
LLSAGGRAGGEKGPMATVDVDLGAYKLGWHDEIEYEFKPAKGLNEDIIRQMSGMKGEPAWMLEQRLKAYQRFLRKPIPQWGGGGALNDIDFDNIYYYIKPSKEQAKDWDMVPESIKQTYEKLGIPEAERKYLAGVTAQYECLRGDVRVFTVDRGMVAIKEIQPGDRVYSLNQKTRQLEAHAVKAVEQTDIRQTYRVEVDGGRVIYATDNHPLLAANGWVTVGELAPGDEVTVAVTLPDAGRTYHPVRPKGTPDTFPEATSAKVDWLFGFAVAGATLELDGGRMVLEADGDTAAILQGTIGTTFSVWAESGGGRVTIDSKPMIRWFQRNGLIGDAGSRRVPAWVFGLPNAERAAFLRGLLDGSRRTGLSGPLAGDVAELAEMASMAGGESRTALARVVSIEPADVAPVFDIEVAGPHNFVAEGIVVHNSEVVYHRNRADLEAQGVLFCDMDTALRDYPDLVKQYFGTIIPANDNKFAALNSAVWSGGSFIYVPPGVHVEQPLQAYFRINSENMGQFERTLIIVDEGGFAHYVEGCSAPVYTTDSLHSAVVEIVVKRGGRCRYTTIQNWSNNVFNLVTKRAAAYADATMEWIDGNIGCLAEGTKVATPSGPKPIELLRPGDEVMSFDDASGRLVWRRVVAKKFSGHQDVREVRVGERRIRATANHPFYSYRYDPQRAKKAGRYQFGYVRADELTHAIVPRTSLDYGHPYKLEQPDGETTFVGSNQYQSRYQVSRRRQDRLNLPELTTDDLMWLFGLFIGDGSIESEPAGNGGHRWAKVVFSVPIADRAHERLLRVMADLAPGVEPTFRADGIAVTWHSVGLAEFFERNGFMTGAHRKRLPEWVLTVPESQRVSLVAGVLDSDGCAPQGRRGFSVKAVNQPLLQDVASVLATLGIRARLYRENNVGPVKIMGYESRSRGAHWLEFPTDARLLTQVSRHLRMAAERQQPRVNTSFRTIGRSTLRLPDDLEIHRIEQSDEVTTEPTWDIEVEGTGNFVAEGFIVHNSRLTMKYPAVWLMEPGAHGEVLSIAYAGNGQHQDAGAKMVHAAPNTTSTIVSKSIAKDGGRAGYRGLVRVEPGAENAKSFVRCDALILDERSRSDTYPYMEIEENDAQIGHEATVSKVGEAQLFYLMSRGLTEEQATSMIVAGFIEPIVRELPMEYAVEMNRLIELNMVEAGAIG